MSPMVHSVWCFQCAARRKTRNRIFTHGQAGARGNVLCPSCSPRVKLIRSWLGMIQFPNSLTMQLNEYLSRSKIHWIQWDLLSRLHGIAACHQDISASVFFCGLYMLWGSREKPSCEKGYINKTLSFLSQNHWFTYNEIMTVESVTQAVSNLALQFGEEDADPGAMVSKCLCMLYAECLSCICLNQSLNLILFWFCSSQGHLVWHYSLVVLMKRDLSCKYDLFFYFILVHVCVQWQHVLPKGPLLDQNMKHSGNEWIATYWL